jgi:two-component system, response regulator YesN
MIGRRQETVEARRAIHRDAVEILRSEFDRPISLGEVASRVATSSRHLQRVFAETGGVGFCEYLRLVRMSRAAELLATGDLSVKEVAWCVGYGDSTQFSKAYKRTYGVSPSESRGRRHGNPDGRPDDDDFPEPAPARPLSLQQDLPGR